MAGIERRVILRSLTAKGFRTDEGASHKRLYYWRGGQKTGVSVSISRGKAHKVYGDDLVTCLKKELRLSTMRDARHFLECQMDQATYDQTVAPLMRWQPLAS